MFVLEILLVISLLLKNSNNLLFSLFSYKNDINVLYIFLVVKKKSISHQKFLTHSNFNALPKLVIISDLRVVLKS